MSKFNLKTVDLSNNKTDSISLDVKNIDMESPRSLAYTISWQLSRRRIGSAKTKTMAEISGTTAKPHKQKGTGSARQGSKRSVQFRGGRTCFGPMPRSFDYTLNKKIIQLAVADAIRLKIKENQVIIFKENYDQDLKTTVISKLLKSNSVKSALFLYDGENNNAVSLVKSVRNIKNVKALDFKAINAYDLLKFDILMLDGKLLETIKEVL